MGTEVPKTQDSSGDSDSNSDSVNSGSCSDSSSDSEWKCNKPGARKPHFSVTSSETGLKLKIAAIPPSKVSPKETKNNESPSKTNPKTKGKKKQLSDSSSECSNCSSTSSSDDDVPLKVMAKKVPMHNLRNKSKEGNKGKDLEGEKNEATAKGGIKNVKVKCEEVAVKRGRGRPRTKFAAVSPPVESGACGSSSSSSSSSTSSSSSSSSSSSDSDTADAAGGSAHGSSADDSSAALVAACSLQVIDEEDLAALLPEQTTTAPVQQQNFSAFPVHASPHDDKSVVDNGDGSSSEMELPPQLVSAAIQRATADSSSSENECSNPEAPHPNAYSSSLLQQFEAQTQLLSNSMTPMASGLSAVPPIACGLSSNPIDGVASISDCVLGQITSLPEINPITPNFLNSSQHLSPQQTEELTQINKDLEEITSVSDAVGITIPNPPSLDDCVDNSDFMNLDITNTGSELGSTSDFLKNSPMTVGNSDMSHLNQIEGHKLDAVSTNSVESQDEIKHNTVELRRKRGRPRKVKEETGVCKSLERKKVESHKEKSVNNNIVNNFCRNDDPPNVSPDSGILSNHNSPTHSPLRRHDMDITSHRSHKKSPQKENSKLNKRPSRSKSKNSLRNHVRSDSSECEYRRKIVEVKHIKTEAPSPVPISLKSEKSERASKKTDHKLDIAALDRMLYATDRVLYPPRRKVTRPSQSKMTSRRIPSRPLKETKSQSDSGESDSESRANISVLSEVYAKRKHLNNKLASVQKKNINKNLSSSWRENQSENECAADDPLDPTWRQIDLNPKYKDILSGYKSDHEIKPYKSCSRVIESGYKSDYGGTSGYRSDYYRSGYKTDHKSGYKTDKSGYKTDHSVRSMRRRMRKLKKTRSVRDRTYYKNQKHFVSDQEIALLANRTFSSLTLGQSSSDIESDEYTRRAGSSPKYISVNTKFSMTPKFSFGFSRFKKNTLKPNPNDLFAPGPVFSGQTRQTPKTTIGRVNIFKSNTFNNNILFKTPSKSTYIGSPLPSAKPVFSHKFGSLPICTSAKVTPTKKDTLVNNNNLKLYPRNLSPKSRKLSKNSDNSLSGLKKDAGLKMAGNIFEKARNTYIPKKSLSKNIFLNIKKSCAKPVHVKKHRRPVVLAPPKINLKPTERLSRVTLKSETKNHHRHRSRRRHRSRSRSRCKESHNKSAETVDQKFSQDMDSLVTNFIKLCQIAPKLVSQHPVKGIDKVANDTLPKCAKRSSKKRKTSDNLEIATPTSKRRHKKQLSESQAKGDKDSNEHKLPLKKRHYHINSSTNNTLSLSLVTSEFDENSKADIAPEKFLCTETDCLGELQSCASDDSPKAKNLSHDKSQKSCEAKKMTGSLPTDNTDKTQNPEDMLKTIKTGINTTVESLTVQIDEAIEACISRYASPNSSNGTDDEFAIKKPVGEHSELSKKIYETSEKLKAVHKMVHDLEKSLPKTKESDQVEIPKAETHKMSPKNESKQSPATAKNSAPIVTPKKRHRLEADKVIATSSLDQVVQSLSKKLSEEKGITAEKAADLAQAIQKQSGSSSPMTNTNSNPQQNATEASQADPLKSMSARSLYKSSIPPAQKSEIMTRKKNRLEGLTSSLVSKINPSTATKMLDTLLNNNIRKSIESRILEKGKAGSETKTEDKHRTSSKESQINTRATVIKSPISKGKLPSEAKKLPKGTEVLLEQTVVVNVDRPTGIFEPTVDLELQIPKSSISIASSSEKGDSVKSKVKLRSSDNKNKLAVVPSPPDSEPEIPLSLITDTPESIINRPKRSESIASVISDKMQETVGGHNLRQSKRNLSNDSDDANDKKRKKVGSNIIRQSKLVLPPQLLQPKVQAEKITLEIETKKTEVLTETQVEKKEIKEDETPKKKQKRRKTNKTGFPSVKKKKKKNSISQSNSDAYNSSQVSGDDSAFERVPKDGEATSSFVERTSNKKPGELKVVLNKDECPRQARLSVIALEKLQGKEVIENIKDTLKKPDVPLLKKSTAQAVNKPLSQLKQAKKSDKDQNVNKWEVLSETDSIPSVSASSVSNDPEDSIPLSLLNLKPERPSSQLDSVDKLKRKAREFSPSLEVEEILLAKRKMLEITDKPRLRAKSSLAALYPSEKRQTRSSDVVETEKPKENRNKDNKNDEVRVELCNPTKAESIITRRKSRSTANQMKKPRDIKSSSRESSLDTLRGLKLSPKSREASVDTLRREHCYENDPLPINEKEIDFEKSIDVLSKNIICKKRVASSRDDSPASSVERNREKDKHVVSKRNPRLRKKFLVAGLFSDYYKVNEPKLMDPKTKVAQNQSECPVGLLAPPPYCERWVRQRRQHFTLPYDIWWQHQYNQPVPSWNYKKIRTNVYYDVKPSAEECESVACNCSPSSCCPEDCINRLVFAECSPQLCPCDFPFRDRCKNQRIQRHEWASGLEKFMTQNKGWGVRTKHEITSGDFILEYVGEVVSDKEFKERMATRYARDTHHYCLHLDGGLVIDGHRMGGDGRFVNHSCMPNCEMQKWTANGTFRMALFALRDIEPGEELTYDYNFSLFNPAEGQPCKCDSTNCRGVIGGKSQRITKLPLKTQSRTLSNNTNQSNCTNQSQPSRVGRPRKAVKCSKKPEQQSLNDNDIKNMTILKYQQHLSKLWQEPQMKPLTAKEKTIARDRHCFLFRNLEKVRKLKDKLTLPIPTTSTQIQPIETINIPSNTSINPMSVPSSMNPSVFLTRLQALRAPRNIKTRRLAQVEDNPELSKQARLANVFRELYNVVVNVKDDKEDQLCAPLLKRKDKGKAQEPSTPVAAAVTQAIPTAPDLSTIEANIEIGKYKSVAQFDADVSGVLAVAVKEHGRLSAVGSAATQLKKVYNNAKQEFAEQLTKILGPNEPLPNGFVQKSKPEEVIMCICGLHFEEGLMVQCGGPGCGVWQHARCMRVTDTSAPHFCHQCSSKKVDCEIPLDEYTDDGHQFFLSLMRGDLQIRQGDTVYVLRDIPIDDKHPDKSASNPEEKGEPAKPVAKRAERKKVKNFKEDKDKKEKDGKSDDADKDNKEADNVRKHTYKTIGQIPVSELDIFRVERLWKHKDTGERYVYGHHYLRPHETYHEPTRKFFPNEVMRVPLYEAVPIDLVMSQCWVMDVNTYCKGRPVCAIEEHVYICELRVDRSARLFTKVSKPKYAICTKAYAFDHFPQRLKISRTYAPHEVAPEYLKGRAAKGSTADTKPKGPPHGSKDIKKKPSAMVAAQKAIEITKKREKQKERVNNIASKLLARGAGGRSPLDASYLLESRRPRKRPS